MRGAAVLSRLLVPIAGLVALFGVSATGQQQTPFKSGASTVAVYTTVTDSTGRLVPNLTKEDFEVYDNGKLQPISVFQNEAQPLSIIVMLDRSGSMADNYRLVTRATEELVRGLAPADKARIGSFADKILIEPEEFTSDHRTLINILRTEQKPDGPTPLWNATNKALASLVDQDGRKVVLLFTDGVDSPGGFKTNNSSVMDVIDRASRDDVMIYTIGLEARLPYGKQQAPLGGLGGFGGGFEQRGMTQRPDPGLPKIADETGGGYFELTRTDDLRQTFARVIEELRQQYTLGFAPPKLDGKRHEIEVKLKQKGMKARARKNYVAAKAAS